MVDDVPKLRAEPELLGLREIQVLVDAEVDVVRPRRLQGVPPRVSQRTQAGSDVLRCGIFGNIGDDDTVIWIAGVRHSAKRGDVGSRSPNPRRI